MFVRSVIAVLLIAYTTVEMNAQRLADYRWQNRLIVISGDSASAAYKEQMSLVSAEQLITTWQERKTLILKNSSLTASKTLSSDETKFSIKLYGLDGGIKMSSVEVVAPQDIIDLIDKMPIRRTEMRGKG
jgi:hypothetical protein